MTRYKFGEIEMVRLLYSGLAQVSAISIGLLVSTWLLYDNSPDIHAFILLTASIFVAILRIGAILSFRLLAQDLTEKSAARWEILYGAGSIGMGLVIAGMAIESFQHGTASLQLLGMGLALTLCNGQASVRVANRLWIPLITGTIVIAAVAVTMFISGDPTNRVTSVLVLLYGVAYVDSCRHSAQTILGRLQAERELSRFAREDTLTALANRRSFEEQLATATHRCASAGVPFAILWLDLDGFKAVNDELGHQAGDSLLSQVGDRLRHTVRAGDHAARVGGDEFAVLVTRFREMAEIEKLADRLVEAVSRAYHLEGSSHSISVSIGIATAPENGSDGGSVRAAADEALYAAKRAGKGKWVRAGAGVPA